MAKRNENLKKHETTIRTRVESEEKAFHIVNNLIDGKVDAPYLIKCGQMISREHYTDVVEERAISYLCGYPLCDHALTNIPKKQYHISTSTNKVYDISERKNFCSNQCLKASKHFCNQIPESPLWTRAKEAPADIQLLPHNEIRGIIGNEVVGTLPQKLLEKEIKKLEELDIRSPSSKKEKQPPQNKKTQTATVNKTAHATKTDEKKDEHLERRNSEELVDRSSTKDNVNVLKVKKNYESLEESKNEELVDRSPPKDSVNVHKDKKPTELGKTLESEASINKDIISQTGNASRQNEELTLCEQKGNLKFKHEERGVVRSSNVIVNAECENVDSDRRFEGGNEQTKIDYLMKLLSKRKDALSGMIDVITVVSDGSLQPTGETLPSAENMNVVSSGQGRLDQTPNQLSSSEKVLQVSGSQVLQVSGSQVLPASGSQVLQVSGSQVLPASGSQVLQVSGSQVLPSSGSQMLPASGSQVLPSSGSQMLPASGSQVLPASGGQVNLNQNLSQYSAAKASKKSSKSSSKKKNSLKSPLERLGAVIKTWVTPETTAYIQSSVTGNSESPVSFSDPRIQRGYASLCQRLDSQQKDFEDLINDTDEGADKNTRSLKSIPDYVALKKESEELQLRVMEFITGKRPETVQKKEDSEEKDPVYIPTIDAYDQKQIRIRIVLDRLDKFLPDLLPPLHLSVQDVSSLIRELVYTFKFDKDNIVFKPSEWILVAIFILKMLGKKNKSIGAAFKEESAVRHFNILFNGIGATVADLDVVTEDICSS